MPSYTFIDKSTNEIREVFLKRIADLDEFKRNNPNLEQCHIHPIPTADPVRIGVRRMDGGFREVLQKIHHETPGSKLDQYIP